MANLFAGLIAVLMALVAWLFHRATKAEKEIKLRDLDAEIDPIRLAVKEAKDRLHDKEARLLEEEKKHDTHYSKSWSPYDDSGFGNPWN